MLVLFPNLFSVNRNYAKGEKMEKVTHVQIQIGDKKYPKIKMPRKRKRCFKNRYAVEKVFGSICDDCPKQSECYPQ